MSATAALIASTLNAGTPLLLAGIGILIHERSGVLNLGIEGIMLMGAVAGFGTCYLTGSFFLGFAAAALVGMVLSALFGFLTLGLYANQNAAGLAMAIFGAGLAAFIGQPLQGVSLAARASEGIPFLRDIPFVGDAFFSSHVLVYVALFMAGAAACFLYKSRWGLILRAAGESPKSAYALGYPVRTIRFSALLFGGLMTGVAGAYLSLVYTPLWAEGMTAGRGWIALALVTFATWRPLRIVLGAYLFGGVTMVQLSFQAAGIGIPSQLMAMAPYLATILVLVLISHNPKWIAMNVPKGLGKTFAPEK